jgi:hypothetical protein
VVDVLLREQRGHRVRQGVLPAGTARTRTTPTQVITDHHQPYSKAVKRSAGDRRTSAPGSRASGETKPIERSHIATRDRLRASRGQSASPLASGSPRVRGAPGASGAPGAAGRTHRPGASGAGVAPVGACPYATTRAVVSALAVLSARLPRPLRRPGPVTATAERRVTRRYLLGAAPPPAFAPAWSGAPTAVGSTGSSTGTTHQRHWTQDQEVTDEELPATA